MRIVVCIKQVPDTTEIKIDPVKGTLIRDGVPSIMNPDDKGGLEQALRFKDRYGAHVTVITMGPPQAEAVLREALAMGGDEGILLSDRKFGGSDSLATSYTLAAALRNLEIDLLITGRQAIDGDTAQVGPQIAEHLDLPQVTYVEQVELTGERTLEVYRATEEGREILEVDMPCVLTILASGYKPRYMSVRGMMECYSRPITRWTSEHLVLDEAYVGLKGSPTRVGRSFTKGAKATGQLIDELTADEAAELIIAKLKERFII